LLAQQPPHHPADHAQPQHQQHHADGMPQLLSDTLDGDEQAHDRGDACVAI
jgi:hypothetical protein